MDGLIRPVRNSAASGCMWAMALRGKGATDCKFTIHKNYPQTMEDALFKGVVFPQVSVDDKNNCFTVATPLDVPFPQLSDIGPDLL